MRYLIQLGFVAIAALGFSSLSSAEEVKKSSSNLEPDEMPIGTTVRCESDMTIGFNWKDGAWKRANFRESAYIFRKFDHRSDEKTVRFCRIQISDDTDHRWPDVMYLNRCYSVQELGGGKPLVQACTEMYSDGEVVSIACGDRAALTFHPDGELLIAPSQRDVRSKPKDDYKDSFVIGVGRCARL